MSEAWGVVVIGAGPAGALAARQCALGGARTLLVDRAAFPRDKVCGCCVNARALETLRHAGLGDAVQRLPAQRLSRVELFAGGRHARLRIPEGVAVSRAALDQSLVDAALAAGAAFLPQTSATIGLDGAVRLQGEEQARAVTAACVIVADGLGGRSLREHAAFASPHTRASSHIGLGTLLPDADTMEAGTIRMACGRLGYLGMVRLGDGRLDVAAALSPALVREAGGASAAARRVLEEAGVAKPPGFAHARWTGTALLTRRRVRLWSRHTLVVGDAAGYVEPFTGEGIAWALAGGEAVAVHALAAARGAWDDAIGEAWQDTHRRLVRRRQLGCRVIASLLRRPALMRAMVGVLHTLPGAAQPIVRRIALPGRGACEAVMG